MVAARVVSQFLVKRWWWLLLLALGVVAAAPTLLLNHVVQQTRGCIDEVERRTGQTLPPCDAALGRLSWLRRVPTVAQPASRANDELRARWAIVQYLDAAVGRPDAERRAALFSGVVASNDLLTQSQNIRRWDELGPPLASGGAVWALRVGELRQLLTSDARLRHHYEVAAAYRAALLLGDRSRALELARAHADPSNAELRLRTAALLCLQGDPRRSMNMLVKVERDWAQKRNANYAHNFGDARVVIEACAAHAGEAAPPVPHAGYAGQWDQRARLLALRLRHAASGCPDGVISATCAQQPAVRTLVEQTLRWLQVSAGQPHRWALLAAIVPTMNRAEELLSLTRAWPRTATANAAGTPNGAAAAAKEPRFARVMINDFIDAERTSKPFVSARQYVMAARHVGGWLPAAPSLGWLVARWRLKATLVLARGGEVRQAQRLASKWGADDAARALLKSTVAALGGRWQQAAQQLAAEPSAPSLLRAQYWLQRAWVTLPAARAVKDIKQARSLLRQIKGGARAQQLLRWADWTALAAGEGMAAAGAKQQRAWGARRRPLAPWSPKVPFTAAQRQAYHRLELLQWSDWVRGAPEHKLALRYLAWHHRGAVAEATAPSMWLAAQLVDEPAQAEVWLDAVSSLTFQTLSLRDYAFARALSARWRGDEAAYQLWWSRYRRLEGWAFDPRDGELYRALRL